MACIVCIVVRSRVCGIAVRGNEWLCGMSDITGGHEGVHRALCVRYVRYGAFGYCFIGFGFAQPDTAIPDSDTVRRNEHKTNRARGLAILELEVPNVTSFRTPYS